MRQKKEKVIVYVKDKAANEPVFQPARWIDVDLYAVWQESHKRWAVYREKFGQLELSLYINCKRFASDQTLLEEYYTTGTHYDEF